MKIKVNTLVKEVLLLTFSAILISSYIFGQGQGNQPFWKINGNSNIGENKFIGTTNANDIIIKTNSQERMRITKDGNTELSGNLNVAKFIVADSLHVLNRIKVGQSLFIGTAGVGVTDDITSDAGIINFGNDFIPNFSNILVGIGTQTPQSKLHLNDDFANTVHSLFTNANTTNGFQVGIDATGIAELRQRDNNDMVFFTNDTERMRLTTDDRIIAFGNAAVFGFPAPAPFGAKFIIHDRNPIGGLAPAVESNVLLRVRGRGVDIGNTLRPHQLGYGRQ